MGRSAAYDWRSDDEEFAKAWDEAIETAGDKLEEVAYRRATTGKSDRLLEVLVKAHRPKYRDKHEVDLRHNLTPEAAEWLGIKQPS
jgi:hypothetical protein